MRPLYRPEPLMPPQAYKTYCVARPLATHWRTASCVEVECPNYARGWIIQADVSTVLGVQQANYIRLHSGRSYTTTQAGTIVTFTFAAGQRCFAEHRVPLHREPVFAVVEGDWRGNPRGTPPLLFRPQAWLDDFGEHQQRLADRLQRG